MTRTRSFFGGRTAQAHVERALAAMANVGLLETVHISAEFRQLEPQRHLPSEHATLAPIIASTCALAGDNKHEPGAVRLRATQKPQQRAMRVALGVAVQVEAAVDLEG